MPSKSVVVPDAVYARLQEIAAAERTTVDQLATEAIEHDLARRWLGRIGSEAALQRDDMSDVQVEAIVERAVRESRDSS